METTHSIYKDIYKSASEREIEVRMRLDVLYSIKLGYVKPEEYQEIRDLDLELKGFNQLRKQAAGF
jgi:hypothetical protein